MEQTVKADKDGTVHLPASLLPHGGPNSVYRVELKPGVLVLLRAEETAQPDLSTEEWVQRFRDWADSHRDGPGLPATAVGRDSIYE